MGTRMRDLLGSALHSLRYEPTEKHLRISLDGEPVADTVNGLLVWEPRRVVPTYAVPETDVAARLESVGRVGDLAELPVLVPTNPFTAHTCTGEMFDVIAGARRRTSAAFRPDDPDLAGYVTFDFSAFEWHEEDEPIVQVVFDNVNTARTESFDIPAVDVRYRPIGARMNNESAHLSPVRRKLRRRARRTGTGSSGRASGTSSACWSAPVPSRTPSWRCCRLS